MFVAELFLRMRFPSQFGLVGSPPGSGPTTQLSLPFWILLIPPFRGAQRWLFKPMATETLQVGGEAVVGWSMAQLCHETKHDLW